MRRGLDVIGGREQIDGLVRETISDEVYMSHVGFRHMSYYTGAYWLKFLIKFCNKILSKCRT
jgi:hypothetical protein